MVYLSWRVVIAGKTQRIGPTDIKDNLFRKTGYSDKTHYNTDYGGQAGGAGPGGKSGQSGYGFEPSNTPFRGYSGFPNRTDLIPYNYPARRY